jgi:hypothetical protein
VESLWGVSTGRQGEYVIDNVPFFATQATLGDVVLVKEEQGVLWFDRVVKPSNNSLLRLVFFQPDRAQEVRDVLKRLGCSTEWDQNHTLIAVNVPPDANLKAIQEYLADQAEAGHLDYEEPILRQ